MLSHFFFFFFNDTATTEIYTLSLHDALPIFRAWTEPRVRFWLLAALVLAGFGVWFIISGVRSRIHEKWRSEEHTSELQSQSNLVCRLLLEKKKILCTCDLDAWNTCMTTVMRA